MSLDELIYESEIESCAAEIRRRFGVLEAELAEARKGEADLIALVNAAKGFVDDWIGVPALDETEGRCTLGALRAALIPFGGAE